MDISGGFADRRNNDHIYIKVKELDQKVTSKIEGLEESYYKTRDELKALKLQMEIIIFFAKLISGLIVTALVMGLLALLKL